MDGDNRFSSIIEEENDCKAVWECLNRFRETDQLCDAILTCQGESFPIHRAILAAHSEYFRALFTNGMKSSHCKEIQIEGRAK